MIALLFSIFLICIAHFIRTMRWQLFVRTYERPNTKNLLSSLSIGYFVNFIVPFKIGDLLRAWIAGKKMKNGRGFALATVIVDRYLDIVVVGFIFAIMSGCGLFGNMEDTLLFYMLMAISIMMVTALVYILRGSIKRILKMIAAIFNPTIEFKLLKFCWSLIWSFKDIVKKISKVKLISYTFTMWILYLGSYIFFADFLSRQGTDISWGDIFYLLFAKNSVRVGSFGISSADSVLTTGQMGWLMLYLLAPIVILFVISVIMKPSHSELSKGHDEYLNLIPHLDDHERLAFLEMYFSNDNKDYVASYLKINQNILIIRDYSAGSNATTMLCVDDDKNFFRKYAFGDDGDKLYEQIKWIQEFEGIIPLPEILRFKKEETYCFYDMPYNSNAVGLFDYAHSMPKEKAWNIIKGALESLENSLYTINVRNADIQTIDQYIKNKVEKNIIKILNAKYLKNLMDYDDVIINGKSYHNLPYYLKYLSQDNLQHVFKEDKYSEIHGDLTIENIICTRNENGEDNYYIIDPNTGNLHDSSNLDYAKLLQSIHGGYEFLMATQNVDVDRNHINFIFTKSAAYTYLYRMLDNHMCSHFTAERVKSIYYHEIIHWLRLMPYKIEKNGKRVCLFYAGMIMVMNDVFRRFEQE